MSKQAEEKLRRQSDFTNALTNSLGEGVYALDREGLVTFMNPAAEKMLGAGWQHVVHPDDLPNVVERWTKALRTGETYQVEFRLKRAADESYRWHLGRALALRDQEGQILKWLGTNTDIEEQKQLEVTLARINRERELMLEEVSTPVVPVWRGVLALPIIGSLDTERMQRATEAALGEVMRTGARACIIDITGARLVDTQAVANLTKLVGALKLVGAEAIVTGVTAQAARSLVSLGVDFTGMRTHRTLAEALASLIKSSK
ncbi:MAG: PAS domain-containing protein [Acidobacteria bacterium]|nr:PAS domain-containing protein [Acidobacteriota bacterium]